MRKTFALSLFAVLFLVSNTQAQITIKRSDYTINSSSDSIYSRLCYSYGVTVPTVGNNLTWDYTTLVDSASTVSNFPISKINLAAPFQNSNILIPQITKFGKFLDTLNFYYRLDSTGFTTVGYDHTVNNIIDLTGLFGVPTDNLIIPKQKHLFSATYKPDVFSFPLTPTTVRTVNERDTINFTLKSFLLGYNNTPGYQIIIEKDSIRTVGWGSIKIKGAAGTPLSYQVLLVQNYSKYIDSFFIDNTPANVNLLFNVGIIQGAPRFSNILNFIGLGQNRSILRMTVSNDGKTVTNIDGISSSKLITDIKDFQSVFSSVYPNPSKTSQTLNFNFDKLNDKDWYITLFNAEGKLEATYKLHGAEGATFYSAKLPTNIAAGFHFYNIVDENSLIRSSGKFVLSSN